MPHGWIEPDVGIAVLISTAGPLDPLGSGRTFDVTDYAGVNYVDGATGITIRRGRSDEFQAFPTGSASFSLMNNNREFDVARTEIAADLPAAVGATVSTPDHAALAPSGDLYVRVRFSMDSWTPGALGQFVIGQWPNSAGNNGWVLSVSATGFPEFSFTTDGTTTRTRTSTRFPGFTAGSVHWLDVLLDVDNGAAGHTVTFRTSEDGDTWDDLASVTSAGVVALFNSTAVLAVGDILPLGGQVYEADVRIGGIFGSIAANPRFGDLAIGTTSFTDMAGRVWTVNGTATVGYDNFASVFAPILKPRRQVQIVAGLVDDITSLTVLFTGILEGWPQSWTEATGRVELVAHDLLAILAQTSTSGGAGAFVLDSVFQGQLDEERLAGDLPQQFTGERIESLIQLAGVSTQALMLMTGLTEMIASEPSGDVLSLCQEAETAEAGFFFVDRGGLITFFDRHARIHETRLAETQATFTDTQYSGLSIDDSTTQMFNEARFTRPPLDEADDPHEAIVTDDVSIHEFGRKSVSKSIPVVSDGETLGRAQFWVQRYGRPRRRPTPITIKPRRDITGMFLSVIRLELLDRVQIMHTPLGIAPPHMFVGLIEQLEHRIDRESWVCTVGISPIDLDDGANCLVLDSTTLGQLDQEVLCY